MAYFLVPTGWNTTLPIIGFPLGFFASGCFPGFGSQLAELGVHIVEGLLEELACASSRSSACR